ncbi:MAG: methyltransferase domain-containing protein [Chloroflexi bacterium]|nr:methyltransferase domain-containing protein [Chloroflexota bacterium]
MESEENKALQRTHYDDITLPIYERCLADESALVGAGLPQRYMKVHRLVEAYVDEQLGSDHSGQALVDFGCGWGEWACYFATLGFEVWAQDISEGNVKLADLRAQRNNLDVRIHTSDCTATEFPDVHFDMATGMALVHHLTLEEEQRFYDEVYRVLKPGGYALFKEPLKEMAWFRRVVELVPVRDKRNPRPSRLSPQWKAYAAQEHEPERPVSVAHFRQAFPPDKWDVVRVVPTGLFSRLDRLTRHTPTRTAIHDWDYRVFHRMTFLRKLFRNVIVIVRKRA